MPVPAEVRRVVDLLLLAIGAAAVLGALALVASFPRRRRRRAVTELAATLDAGDWEEALRRADSLDARALPPRFEAFVRYARALAWDGLGESARALAVAPALPEVHANLAVCVHVTAGLYAEALQIARAALASPRGSHLTPGGRALIRINAAEALYNMGRWEDAWMELEGLDAQAASQRLARDGLWMQRAWILAQWGRGEEALAALGHAGGGGIPPAYHAELRFARAAALLALGRNDDAVTAVREGLALAKRASSERNGLYLLARIAAARSDWQEAEAQGRRAAGHRYQGQGGGGLLLWGESLENLGRIEEARAAWSLALERDPQSEAAARAADKLRNAAPRRIRPLGSP